MTSFPQDTTFDAARILESITDAFFALDSQWRFTYVNSQAERVLLRTREELLGKSIWDEFPAAVGSISHREYQRAVDEQVTVSFEDYYAPLATWFENHLFPSPDGLSVYFRDVNERKRSEEALHRSEERLRDAQARLEASLSAGGIATWNWDLVNERIVADANLARLFCLSPEDAADGRLEVYLQAMHPEDRPRVVQAIDDAIVYRDQYNPEYRVILPDGSLRWLAARGKVERDAEGKAVALPGVVVDITERVEREQRERFLAELAERARRLTDPDEVIADAVRSVGEFLGVSRCVFADIDIAADTCTIPPDYCADDSVASMAGVFPISAFGPFLVAEYGAGRTVAVDDVRIDPVRVPADYLAAYEAVACRAFIATPVLHSARLVSVLAVHSATPRHWKPEEVALLQTVVERTWLTVEVIRQNHALGREAEATTRILESITDAFFALDTEWRFTYINDQSEQVMSRKREDLLGRIFWDEFPATVGSTFEREFRRAVNEQTTVTFEEFYPPLEIWVEVRAYPSSDGLSVFYQNVSERKRAEEALRQSEERYRLLVDSTGEGIYGIDLEGRFTFVNHASAQLLGYTQTQIIGRSGHALIHHTRPDGIPYPEVECPIYHALRSGKGAHAEDDVFWRADGTSFPVAYSAAPILEHGTVRGVVVTFSDISERKALDEERERLAQRERNIATQLQAALTPSVPEHIPGMALAKHYEAALAEAGVGGDFYDVFPVEKGCIALVVGDLAGKGLAAASQVATVRNMLRYAVFRARTLAGGITNLNDVLAEQGLLTGFATLFVGTYDSGAGVLTYVNCGQEPALLRRVGTGTIEQIGPTGPVLGSFEGAVFEEQAVTLRSGDTLAVFTDGLTEVGRSRMEMLGVEGVSNLLTEAAVAAEAGNAEAMAEHLALGMIAGVNAAAQGGVMRDDMCLLVAVVE